jgi:hypothetical protein
MDSSTILCGKRSEQSYMNMTRTEMDQDSKQFNCPNGLYACSTNGKLGGSTTCETSLDKCPIFDLQILDKDSASIILSDPNYTSRLSPLPSGTES